MPFHCLCCGFNTLPKQPPGSYEICPICGWEDSHTENAIERSNDVTLREAQKNYDEIGACEPKWIDTVRRPTRHERRVPKWLPIYRLEQHVIKTITTAFASVSRGIYTLRQARVIDDYGTPKQMREAGRLDTDTHWTEVSDEDIKHHTDIHTFLDDASFRYYIPAYMVWSIKNYNGDNTISCESTIRALILDPWGNEESRRADIAKFQMFDQAQSAAVLAFLRFMNDIDGATNAILAIEKYWGRFALHTD